MRYAIYGRDVGEGLEESIKHTSVKHTTVYSKVQLDMHHEWVKKEGLLRHGR